MRVLMVIPVLDPATGGPPGIAVAQAVGLGQLGIEVEIAAYDGWGQDTAGAERARAMMRATVAEGEGSGIEVRSMGRLEWAETVWCGQGRRVLRGLLAGGSFDVVHLHGVWDPAVMWAACEARAAEVPYVLSSHGMLEPWAVRKRWKKEIFWQAGWGGMLRHAAGVHDHKDGPLVVMRRELGVRVWNIANGVWPARAEARVAQRTATAAAWEKLCTRWPVLRGKRVVLFLARLAEQKAPEVLVEAFGRVTAELGEDVVLLMAGPDYGEERLARSKAAGHAWAGRVVWAGGLFGAEKAAALAWAEVFALPSRHEGFSIAVLEAMQSGLACVITPACHFSRALDVGAAEVVDSDPAEVGAALLRVMSVPGRTAEMGERGRALVEREYTWQSVARQLKEMYQVVIKKRC